MGFKIIDSSLDEFIADVRKIEASNAFSTQGLVRGYRNNYDFSELGFNVNKYGTKIFSLKLRQKNEEAISKDFAEQAKRIPIGNYYLEFYHYKSNGKIRYVPGCVDLKWNINGDITKNGIQPFFAFVTDFRKNKENGSDSFDMLSIRKMLHEAIVDRLKQLCSNKISQDPHLISESIRHVLNKHCETSLGNRDNYSLKVRNRVVFIPEPKEKDNGYRNWRWHPQRNKDRTFSDCLSKTDSVDTEVVKEILDYFQGKIILGESSEEGARKGTFIILNEALQLARGNTKEI